MRTANEVLMENLPLNILIKEAALIAMEEFAKEIAIDFTRWKDENEYANSAALGRTLTTEELYNYYANNIFPDK